MLDSSDRGQLGRNRKSAIHFFQSLVEDQSGDNDLSGDCEREC